MNRTTTTNNSIYGMSTPITLQVHQFVSVTTRIIDAYGVSTSAKTINYVSSDPTVAILDDAGDFVQGTDPQNSVSTNVIRGLSNGIATISVTADGTLIDTIVVTVQSNPPAALVFIFGTPSP